MIQMRGTHLIGAASDHWVSCEFCLEAGGEARYSFLECHLGPPARKTLSKTRTQEASAEEARSVCPAHAACGTVCRAFRRVGIPETWTQRFLVQPYIPDPGSIEI